MTNAQPPVLIQSLMNAALYDHPVTSFRLIETHISWIILTGDYAYKIKKPVDFGFLDFSTLAKRHHYCDNELRLNRRLEPDIYLAVVPIRGSEQQPQWQSDEPIIEWAVKMRQFESDSQLDVLAKKRELTPGIIDQLASRLCDFHHSVSRTDQDSPYGSPAQIEQPVSENYQQIIGAELDQRIVELLQQCQHWHQQQHQRLAGLMAQRKDQGLVRECHGDLHLANIAYDRQRILIFDCIEFNDELRWIDIISEMAFVAMDLDSHDYTTLKWRLLNHWLQVIGDYNGLRLLPYYLVYRAMVRAKVAVLSARQSTQNKAQAAEYLQSVNHYIELAHRYVSEAQPLLIICHGLSGSGKSTISKLLAESLGAIHVRSDVERKRLFNLPADAHTGESTANGIYQRQATVATYQRLADCARDCLDAGMNVIVDATFLQQSQREDFKHLAQQYQAPMLILNCVAPTPLMEQWIQQRQAQGTDPSEANVEILHYQLKTAQPLGEAELAFTVTVDTSKTVDAKLLAAQIKQRSLMSHASAEA